MTNKKLQIEPRLGRLQALRLQKQEIIQEEATLSAPLLTDYELLPKLYEQYNKLISSFPASHRPDSRAQKKLFLFIALYLYSPQALVGGSIERGFRSHLARTMNVRNSHAISYHCEGLVVWYLQYPDFRKAIDYLLPRLLKFAGF